MSELLWWAFIAHHIGDLMLQSKEMALHKADKSDYGKLLCTILAVYIPHWIIDRWSLAGRWLKLVRSRTFATVTEPHREFDVAFTSIVYKDVDELMHLLCLGAVIYWMKL